MVSSFWASPFGASCHLPPKPLPGHQPRSSGGSSIVSSFLIMPDMGTLSIANGPRSSRRSKLTYAALRLLFHPHEEQPQWIPLTNICPSSAHIRFLRSANMSRNVSLWSSTLLELLHTERFPRYRFTDELLIQEFQVRSFVMKDERQGKRRKRLHIAE